MASSAPISAWGFSRSSVICGSIDKTLDEYRQWSLLSVPKTHARETSEMIARVAQFRFPDLQHREEAERNGTVRVGPSLARQPGFQAIYYGRTGELEAVSISLFEDRESADTAAITMNTQPLLDGQVPEMLPTPDVVTFYEVVTSVVRDEVPTAGRLGYLTLAPGQVEADADRWGVEACWPILER